MRNPPYLPEDASDDVKDRAVADAVSHFSQVPWCAAMLRNAAWTPTRTASRVPKASTEDSFIAETLATSRTIRRFLTLRPKEPDGDDPAYKEVRMLLDVGDGINGHPNISHGGFVATMLDEMFGFLVTLNIESKVRGSVDKGIAPHHGMSCFTAYLNTSYKKPVPTPGVVLLTAKFERKEGKKIYVRGTVEDGRGTTFATGDAMFVEVKTKL